MKNFRVHAVVLRNGNGGTEGVRFSEVFAAKDRQEAIKLARQKFVMIHDDLKTVFQEDDDPEVDLEIVDCREE